MQFRPHVERNQPWRVAGICVFLAAITLAVFSQTFHYHFVNLDDDLIVTDNPHVTPGLSLAGIAWAFTHFDSFFYTPLTSISHMLDCSLYGFGPEDAGGHHFTNVLIHAVSVILLFLVLREMTGGLWSSAFVAALFAIHPLHVESVAWVSERKDVLSGLFFMLTLGAYAHFARRPQSLARYLMVLALFALSLLSKPSVVPLPFLLLLLDYWPLGRFQSAAPGSGKSPVAMRLVLEKIPLLALSAVASVIAVLAQGEAVQTVEKYSIPARIANALFSCAVYIMQMFHPVGLTVFYPHPGDTLPVWKMALSLLLLVSITAAVLIFGKKYRYLVTGWFWFLAMLAPVAGIVQVGIFARADRFTYLSQIGLYLMGTWMFADWSAAWRRRRMASGVLMAVVIAELSVIAWGQASYWKNSVDLWTHTLKYTTGNFEAENSLGAALIDLKRVNDAVPYFQNALNINPRYDEARNNLGVAYFELGETEQAIQQFQRAIEINPRRADVRVSLGDAFYQGGRDKEAIAEYEKALEISPDYAKAQSNLAWMLATSPDASLRNGARAVELAHQAYAVFDDKNPVVIRTLAAAYGEAGRFPEALETAQRALRVAESQNITKLAVLLRSEIDLYRSHVPFHRGKSPKAAGESSTRS